LSIPNRVNALDAALCKALVQQYPTVTHFHMADFKVWILESGSGTAATTRVLIDSQSSTARWNAVGASANIIEANWRALADAVEHGLTQAPAVWPRHAREPSPYLSRRSSAPSRRMTFSRRDE
jgi:2-isopropylmalate synthase